MPILQGIKEAAVAAVGVYLAYLLLILFGSLFLIPGVLLVRSERKKEKKNKANEIFGWVLIVIGCIILLPFVIDILFYMAASELDIFGGSRRLK